MPEFDEWNKPDILPLNNCYNYATNNRSEPKKGEKAPETATPGKKGSEKDIKIKPIGAGPGESGRIDVPGGKVRILKITCERLKEAVVAERLKEPKDGKCDDCCWKVHYYVQEPGAPAVMSPSLLKFSGGSVDYATFSSFFTSPSC